MNKFFSGALVGSVITATITLGGAALADSSVQAVLSNSIKFTFDGVQKQLPDGYSVLSYQDHTYVPARFVAEALGAKVDWDDSTQTVVVTSNNGGSSSSSPAQLTSQSVGHYTFSNYSLDNSSKYFTKIIGEVVNNDTQKHDFSIKVNLYDASGKLLGTATDVIFDIGPGQKKSFEAVTSNLISGIATYSFQVDNEL